MLGLFTSLHYYIYQQKILQNSILKTLGNLSLCETTSIQLNKLKQSNHIRSFRGALYELVRLIGKIEAEYVSFEVTVRKE